MLKLSIIIPLFNTEDYISETLDSIIKQKLDNIEIIVIDDASSDTGPMLAAEYSKKYAFIKLIKNNRKKGVSGARNTGLKAAKAEYITFLDSDDLFLDDILNYKIKQLDCNPDINIISSDFVKFTGKEGLATAVGFYEGKTHITQALEPFKQEKNIFVIKDPVQFYIDYTCPLWTGSVIIRRKHINKIGGFDENLSQSEDMELWYRLSLNEQLMYISLPSTAYRIREGSAITQTYKRHQGLCQFRRQIYHNVKFKKYKEGLYKRLSEDVLDFIYYCRENELWFEALKLCFSQIYLRPHQKTFWQQIIAILLLRN